MNDKTWGRWLTAVLALAVIAAACGGGGGGESQPSEAVETTETAAAAEPADPDGNGGAAEIPQPTDTAPETPVPADSDPGGVEDQERLVAPVDTTTTSTPPADAEAEPEPQSGGTLRVGVEAEGDGLNPAANNFALSAYIMTHPVFDPLAYFDTDGNWVPVLAESFTKIGDGTEWQMRLREGVRFHDGTEVDADDVVATFNAQLADPVISLAYKSSFDPDEPISKIDDYTVRYKTTGPWARMPSVFTSQLGMILPSEWLQRALEDPSLNQMPVGQGPFMISSRVQDEVTVLVRNPGYWAADRTPIHLDRIEIYPIPDTAIAAERLVAGDLDAIVTNNPEAILTLREAQDVTTIENTRADEEFLVINSARPPFDDIRARQALTFATDRDTYVELILHGTAPAADTMFHPDLVWHNPDIAQQTNMPELAGTLVQSYCADNPGNCAEGRINMGLSYSGPSVLNTRIAELQISTLGEFFNVEAVELLQDDLILQVVLGNYNTANWRQFGAVQPDDEVLWLECATIGLISLNFTRYCDPQRDALIYESRATDDLERRVEIWHRIQEMIRDSYTYIFYNHTNWTIGARHNVHNICGQTAPDGQELFCNMQGRILLNQLRLN